MKNEQKQKEQLEDVTEQKTEMVNNTIKKNSYRIPLYESDLISLNVTERDFKKVEIEIRNILNLPERTKNTKKALLLKKLGLSAKATQKELMQKLSEIHLK